MAGRIGRGDIWLYRFAQPDKRRPVLVLSRSDAIPFLHTVMVAPITSTIRGLRTEVALGEEHGLKSRSVVNLNHVHTVRKEDLRRHVATVPPEVMEAVCRALAVATGCG